jgi:hypothetical protein
MKTDVFGNLMDWGNVLEKLDDIKKSGALEDHQTGLVRILRYKENWRLTEHVLECIREINMPTDELIQEACRIMCDDGAYIDMRILAATALGDLVPKRLKYSGEEPKFGDISVFQVMQEILASPQAPVFHKAVSNAIEAAG